LRISCARNNIAIFAARPGWRKRLRAPAERRLVFKELEVSKTGEDSVKVVLFCGGFGMRMREYSEALPKPMVAIGYRPILWHVMKYYAHYGHKDFILCLGYKADVIKKYFLEYDECVSNDFVLSRGGKNVELLSSDIDDWNITFVDTGLTSNVGQRLKAVRSQLEGEEMFLANYTDGLSDVPLPVVIESLKNSGNVACFVGVKPRATFHLITMESGGVVTSIEHVAKSGTRMNGDSWCCGRRSSVT
jgi:glucose-1-phosphate cytidylyltransferase